MSQSCEMHLHCKFGDRRSVDCANNADVSIFYDDLKRSKGSQGDLVFGVPSGFISGPVRAALQVSECSGYDLCYPGLHPDTDGQTETALDQVIAVYKNSLANSVPCYGRHC